MVEETEKTETLSWKNILIGSSVAALSFAGFYFYKYYLEEEEIIQVKKNISLRKAKLIFDEYDLDKNGKLNKQELSNYIENLTKNYNLKKISQKEKDVIFKKIHHAENGEITFEEFSLWLNSIAEVRKPHQKVTADETKIKKLFKKYDENGDGKLDKKELSNFVDYISEKFHTPKQSASQKMHLFEKIKKSKESDSITYEEFSEWYKEISKPKIDFSNIKKLFQKYDKNQDGMIDRSELVVFLNDFSEYQKKGKPTEEQVNEIFEFLDKKKQGGISYSDFYKWAIKFNDDFKWKLIRNFFDNYSKHGDDETGNQGLNSNDLSLFLEDLSNAYKIPKPSLTQVKSFFDKIDKDHNGKINYEEFVEWINSLEKIFSKKFDVKKFFHLFDEDGDGTLDEQELGHFFDMLYHSYHQHVPSDEEKHKLFKKMDSNNSGDISFEEFNNWYQDFLKNDKKLFATKLVEE
eukprot:gene3721-6609_t